MKDFLFSILGIIISAIIIIACNNNESSKKLEGLPFLKDINDSIKKNPSNPGFYLGRASRLVKNDYWDEALSDVQTSWKLLPTATAALQKFNILLAQKKQQEAIDWLKNCIKILPPSLYLQLILSDAYLQAKDTTTAKEILRSVQPLMEQSQDPFDIHQSGELLLIVQDTVNALRYAQKSYTMQPLNNEAGFLIAYILSMKKDKSILLFTDTLLKNCDQKVFYKIYFFKGRYFENINQYKNAILWYNKAIEQLWSFSEAYIHKVYCQKKLHQYKEALQTLSVASQIQTPTDELMFEVGDCYEHLGDTLNAIEYYQNALKNNTINKDTVNHRIQRLKKIKI